MNLPKKLAAGLLACLLPVAIPAQAGNLDALKIGAAGDSTDVMPTMRGSRLVTFRYSENVSFAIRALQDTFVNIEVPEGEVVQGLYLSDAMQWSYHVSGDNRRVLIKPSAAGLVNTGTLVTDKRSYELTMISVPLGESWFQRVRWQVPGAGGQSGDGLYWRGQMGDSAGTQPGAPLTAGGDIDPARMRFGYKVAGKAGFVPSTIFDDGVRTWFRFDGVQDMPAIFARRGGELEVVDYSIQGPYLVVPTTADGFVLRLRKEQVTVERRR